MATPYSGNPNGSAHSPSPAPGPAVVPIVNIPADTDPNNVATMFVQQLETIADFLAYRMQRDSMVCFGDGSDGAATLDGTVAAPSWATKSGAVYTMTRDVFLTNLTVTGSTTVLKNNGYRIYGQGTLTTVGGAKVSAAGNNAVTQTGGVGGTAGSLGVGGAGGNGGTTAAGSAGGSVTNSGVVGGGGSGGLGTNGAGGVGGSLGNFNVLGGSLRLYSAPTFGYVTGGNGGAFSSGLAQTVQVTGGPGGGGGGAASGVNTGGGGGAGGGVLCIAFRNIVLNQTNDLTAAGGNGWQGIATNAGGGGGGAGGMLIVVYCVCNAAAAAISSINNCSGGAGGASGGGTGVAGSGGGGGVAYAIQLA